MNSPASSPLARLRHHVSGAIARGEAQAVTEIRPTAHTPGPWRFVADGEMDDDCNTPRVPVPFDFTGPGYHNNPSIEGPGGETVVGCGEYLVFGPNFNGDKGTRAANVALMCAAPDLLNLLTAADRLGELTGENLAVYARTFAALARAAIAKAKGEAL